MGMPEPALPKGTRVRFVRDWSDKFGRHVPAGQLGTVTGGHESVLVALDGFEDEKAQHKRIKDRGGEGPNIVDWLLLISLDYLEIVEAA